jgi:catechol 2,3-dioxygenase-like lactoylglutathione lyase family enzyme
VEKSPEVIETLHTGFTVADLRATLKLLRECFGFSATEPHTPPSETLSRIIGVAGAVAEIAYVSMPGHRIELLQYLAPVRSSVECLRPYDVGFAHMAFLVNDVDAMATKAAKHGFQRLSDIPTIEHGRNRGRKATYLRDAAGFTIELMGP